MKKPLKTAENLRKPQKNWFSFSAVFLFQPLFLIETLKISAEKRWKKEKRWKALFIRWKTLNSALSALSAVFAPIFSDKKRWKALLIASFFFRFFKSANRGGFQRFTALFFFAESAVNQRPSAVKSAFQRFFSAFQRFSAVLDSGILPLFHVFLILEQALVLAKITNEIGT